MKFLALLLMETMTFFSTYAADFEVDKVLDNGGESSIEMKIIREEAAELMAVALEVTTEPVSELSLLITKSDGSSVAYNLDKMPVLCLEDSLLKVSSDGLTDTFPWKEVTSLSYVSKDYIKTKIESVDNISDFSVVFYENRLSIFTTDNQLVKVYNVNGKMVYQKSLVSNSPTFINYSQFAKGIYILKCGKRNLKFYVK